MSTRLIVVFRGSRVRSSSSATRNQTQHLHIQEEHSRLLRQELHGYAERQKRLSSNPVSAPSTSTCSLQLAQPEKLSGDSVDCRPFLIQCGLHFELQARTFQTERAKIAFLFLHLTGRAEAWQIWQGGRLYSRFSQTFSQIF